MISADISNGIQYDGTGLQAVFDIPWRVDYPDEVEVVFIDEATSAVTTAGGYIVGPLGEPFSQVTFTGTLPPNTVKVWIRPTMPVTQPTNLRAQGRFDPEVVETALDRIVRMIASRPSRGEIQGSGDMLLRPDLATGVAGKGTDLVKHVPQGANAIALVLRDLLEGRNGEPVTNYATVAQLELDATVAVQRAILAARANGKNAVYFPGGIDYYFPAGSATIDPGEESIDFFGDGAGSRLIVDEGTPGGFAQDRKWLFRNATTHWKPGVIKFRNLAFRGRWQETGYPSRVGGGPFYLSHYQGFVLESCTFDNFAAYLMLNEYFRWARVLGCNFDKCALDNVRIRSTPNVVVMGCTFKNTDDDAVALHSNAADVGVDVREGLVVCNNYFEDCSGIRILGGRCVSIHDNVLKRTKGVCISVYNQVGGEADVGIFGVSIHDNQCYDHFAQAFAGPASQVIHVTSVPAEGGTGTANVPPGQNNAVTGNIISPFPFRNAHYSSTVDGVEAPKWLNIHDNIIQRTLPAVAQYTDWGYGPTYSSSGPHSLAVTEAMLQPNAGILMSGQSKYFRVHGNIVGHVGACMYFEQTKDNFAIIGRVDHNTFFDFSGTALQIATPSALRTCQLTFADNEIDGDPLFRSPNRGAAGTWVAATTPNCMTAISTKGVRFHRNHVRNVARMVDNAGSATQIHYQGNVYYGVALVDGFHATNKGCGEVVVCGVGWDFMHVDANPLSATYNELLSTANRDATVIPSAGSWVRGQFVRNGAGSTVHGWQRLVTGSAHVAGTDWKTVALT